MQVERLVEDGRTLKSSHGTLLESDAPNQPFGVSPAKMLFLVVIQVPQMTALWRDVHNLNVCVIVHRCPQLGIAQYRDGSNDLFTVGTVSLEMD